MPMQSGRVEKTHWPNHESTAYFVVQAKPLYKPSFERFSNTVHNCTLTHCTVSVEQNKCASSNAQGRQRSAYLSRCGTSGVCRGTADLSRGMASARILCCLIGLLLGALMSTVRSLSLNSCDSNPRVKISRIELNPAEIRLGQDVSLDVDWEVMQGDIVKPIKAQFKLVRDLGLFGIKLQVPCTNGIGSCTNENICRSVPDSVCHFSKGSHSAHGFRVKIPSVKGAAGSYDVEVRLTDGNGRSIGCWKGGLKING